VERTQTDAVGSRSGAERGEVVHQSGHGKERRQKDGESHNHFGEDQEDEGINNVFQKEEKQKEGKSAPSREMKKGLGGTEAKRTKTLEVREKNCRKKNNNSHGVGKKKLTRSKKDEGNTKKRGGGKLLIPLKLPPKPGNYDGTGTGGRKVKGTRESVVVKKLQGHKTGSSIQVNRSKRDGKV